MTIDVFHLPGLQPQDVLSWETQDRGGGVSIRFPRLRPGSIRRITAGLAAARAEAMLPRDTAQIVAAVDRAAARLADPEDPLRRTADAALPAITGYSEAMLRYAFGQIVADWRGPALELLLRADLPDPLALDRFVARPVAGVRSRGFGPRLAFHVFAGNVPGVAVTSLIRSLLVKAATLGKTASGEPLLPVLFALALADADPPLGRCIAVTYWPRGDAIENEAFAAADVVIAYGGEDALAHARKRTPARTRLVEHGPKVSFAMVGAGALTDRAAAAAAAQLAARAVATFDQQGCVSPHLLYVEEGGRISPGTFSHLLAHQLGELAASLPRGALSAPESAAIHAARAAAEFRAIAGQDIEVLAGDGTSWTVIHDPDPRFEASCLNRLVRVKPVPRLEDVPSLVADFRDSLQTVGVIGAGDSLEPLADALGAAGATRVTSLAAMPWPPASWHHDGRGPLRELLRWVDLED